MLPLIKHSHAGVEVQVLLQYAHIIKIKFAGQKGATSIQQSAAPSRKVKPHFCIQAL